MTDFLLFQLNLEEETYQLSLTGKFNLLEKSSYCVLEVGLQNCNNTSKFK